MKQLGQEGHNFRSSGWGGGGDEESGCDASQPGARRLDPLSQSPSFVLLSWGCRPPQGAPRPSGPPQLPRPQPQAQRASLVLLTGPSAAHLLTWACSKTLPPNIWSRGKRRGRACLGAGGGGAGSQLSPQFLVLLLAGAEWVGGAR